MGLFTRSFKLSRSTSVECTFIKERNRERAKFKHLEYKFQKKLFDNLIEKEKF